MRGTIRTSGIAGLIAVTSFLFAACGGASIPVVEVGAADFSFSLPDSVEGGLTRFSLTNSGRDAHHMQLLKLNEGVTQQQFDGTIEQVLQAIPEQGEAALFGIFEVSTLAGGPAGILPGGQTETVLDLAKGEYALVCFIAGADGIPHIAKGMVKPLTVTAPAGDRPAEPDADATVAMNDFAFTGVPVSLSIGKTTLKVVNQGQEPHEMAIFRLKGVSISQAREILMTPPDQAPAQAGPPPFEEAGGLQAVMPGMSAWVIVDLEPGEYGLVCFVPSPSNEFAPHFALGMISAVTVR